MRVAPTIRRQKFKIGLELVQEAVQSRGKGVEISKDGVRRVAAVDAADNIDDRPAHKKLRIEVRDELVDPKSDFARDFAILLGTAGGLYHSRPINAAQSPQAAPVENVQTPSQQEIEALATTVTEEWGIEKVTPEAVADLLTGVAHVAEPSAAPRKTPAAVPRVPMTLPEEE